LQRLRSSVGQPKCGGMVSRFYLPFGCIALLTLKSPRNLQAANHVIFVSCFVAKTQHEYTAATTQAIGRVLRMGQTRDVHVYHFLAEKTIEVNILEERTGKVLARREGELLLLEAGELKKGSDVSGFGGLPFKGAACGRGGGLDDVENEQNEK
jgi:superfamily II DNA or RNA helicase